MKQNIGGIRMEGMFAYWEQQSKWYLTKWNTPKTKTKQQRIDDSFKWISSHTILLLPLQR